MKKKHLLFIPSSIAILVALFAGYALYNGYKNRPSTVLKEIYKYAVREDYEKIREYFYNIEYKENGKFLFNSADKFIEGIKDKKIVGQFSYSEKGILFHAKYIDKNISKENNYSNIKRHLLDTGIAQCDKTLENIIYTQPDKILYYEVEFTVLIFVKINNR
ncbi:MAG TPA: hypothetical protein PK426_08170, partial [Spirochaetota bacterium]|nr:hypothetical protein [Spirochaetota bacterium]